MFRRRSPAYRYHKKIDLRGRRVFHLVTVTFGALDFLCSILAEGTDDIAQIEVERKDFVLKDAKAYENLSSNKGRSFGQSEQLSTMTEL